MVDYYLSGELNKHSNFKIEIDNLQKKKSFEDNQMVYSLEIEIDNLQKKKSFEDNQMVYLLVPHSSALQMSTMKFRQDFIGPLFIDTTLDKTHYRLKDATGLLLDGTYHVNCIKKGSACTLQGIVNTFDDYEKALKNTLLNKSVIDSPDNKFVASHLKMVQRSYI